MLSMIKTRYAFLAIVNIFASLSEILMTQIELFDRYSLALNSPLIVDLHTSILTRIQPSPIGMEEVTFNEVLDPDGTP